MRHTLLIILLLLSSLLLAANARMVARIPAPTPDLIDRFLHRGADIAAYKPGVYLDLVVDATGLAGLQAEFPNIAITQTEQQLKANLTPDRDIPGYRSYSQLQTELLQLQAQYPYLMQMHDLGSGWGAVYASQNMPAYQNYNHRVWGVKVSANVLETEDEPAFYFIGEHHAREPLSTEVCMGILIHLLESYGTDMIVTDILNTSEIWIVPLLNPDGHKVVLDQTDVWWRKNIRDNNNNAAFDHSSGGEGWDGVDLNRNYGYQWGYTSATDEMSQVTYHGTSGFSEPETQIVRDLVMSRRFLAGIGYHTYGQLVLYPYGFVQGITAPDAAELESLANELAAQLPGISGGNYAPGPSWGLYPASGTFDDWSYYRTGTYSYTIEMAEQFIPPASQVAQIVPQQVAGAVMLMQRKNKKILKGHISDAETGAPLEATVYIPGFDDHPVSRAAVRSDAAFGSYYYLLPPGTHTVHYICPGYQTETRIVNIQTNAPTLEDVYLMAVQAQPLQVNILDDEHTPIAGATLRLSMLDEQTYTTDQGGQIEISPFHPGNYQLLVEKAGFETLNLFSYIGQGPLTLRLSAQPSLTEDFESGLDNWTFTGSWGRSSNQAQSGSYSLTDSPSGNYQNNGNSTCRLTQPINLAGVQNVNLKFWLRKSLALDGDCLILECSPTGAFWQYVDHFTGTSGWTQYSYNLNSYLGDQLYLRFRLYTGSWGTLDGVYIDDIKLYLSANPTPVDDPQTPAHTALRLAGPNPFPTTARMSLSSDKVLESVSLKIYNIKGQLVRNMYMGDLTPGTSHFEWDGRNERGAATSPGVYLARLTCGNSPSRTLRVLKIK